MDNASDYESEDCRFESCLARFLILRENKSGFAGKPFLILSHESSEIKVRKTQDEIKVESPQASPRKLKSAMTLFSNPSVTRVRQDFVEYFLNPFFKYADTTYSDTSTNICHLGAEYLKTWTLNLINNYQISEFVEFDIAILRNELELVEPWLSADEYIKIKPQNVNTVVYQVADDPFATKENGKYILVFPFYLIYRKQIDGKKSKTTVKMYCDPTEYPNSILSWRIMEPAHILHLMVLNEPGN
ncbi:hypothetical protein RF11_00850 [Thelohanellus kitauei]|uniref:Uncharacterized protein n=1 Tax=Thelohanellus kitauei TaxID=669202 RepID=A0A0C2IXV2_THEKT|nr:hypothetical protein RF11_00850 [Thelohanellus kitauei]